MTGTVMASVRTMLRSGNDPSEPRAIAYHLLIALGVPPARAREITDRPLPEIAVRQ
jgi:hypothetical protein